MNYVVIDLEFNQNYDFTSEGKKTAEKTVSEPRCPFEIIQIGAVLLDSDLKEVRSRSFFVKPQIYTRMHPIVEKITGITLKDLEDEQTFDVVYQEFIDFIGEKKSTLCVWGSNDIIAMYRNILYYDLNNKLLTRKYINVQLITSKYLKHPANHSIGLKHAAEALELETDLNFHDALNDAIYTAKIFQKVYRSNLVVQKFNLSQLKQRNLAKVAEVNSGLLFHYAEKEFNRKLTDKEKEIVIKIYNSGQLQKFSIKNELQ